MKPKILWADLTVAAREAELPAVFDRHFFVVYQDNARQTLERIRVEDYDCICFDFDYPDRESLQLMRRINERFPSIPMLMLTTQHSESLAVWAYRTRIWDYFVKPIPETDLDRALATLAEICTGNVCRRQRKRQVFLPRPVLPQEVRLATHSPDELLLLPAIYHVERNYRRKILINELAELCGISSFRFSRAFHAAYNITFQDYLLRYRIKEACRLLDNPNASVSDVSYIVGFNDPSYFARIFKRYVGMCPSEFAAARERPDVPEPLPGTRHSHTVALSAPSGEDQSASSPANPGVTSIRART
ncbi:MAG: response regulator transcription factor [Woeseiaceae bacterium]|nr:response regulator transcription factor [Woeseiaceae bacterium]